MRLARAGLVLCLAAFGTPPLRAQDPPEVTEAGLEKGRRLYQAQCGRCHGMLGRGGEGPSLVQPRLPRAPDHQTLLRVIRFGIPGTGMPGFGVLRGLDADLLAAYVLILGEGPSLEIDGDATRGAEVFATVGDCYRCHIVDGRGTAVGPELTHIGPRRGAEHLYRSLTSPGSDLPEALYRYYPAGYAQYLPVSVVTREGLRVRGMRVNEDAFTIQLITVSGRRLSFRKSELTTIQKDFGHSFMPEADDLTERDLDDLVAYLLRLGGGP